MAKAITTTLSVGHALTYPNVRRYVTRERLACYSIRLATNIFESDWQAAIQLAREERTSGIKPIRQRDRELLAKRRLADTMRRHRATHPLVSTGTTD